MSNYQQPDYRVPSTPGVTVQVENATQPGNTLANPLGVTWPLPVFTEKVSDKDDPQHSIRNGRSGH